VTTQRGKVSIGFLHPGHYAACFAESLMDATLHDLTGAGRIMHPYGKMGKECGSAGIVAGRNKLAQVMCDESPAEWLFMVDSDMGFAGDTIERLVGSADRYTRPVIGALCFALKTFSRSSFYGVRYVATPTLYEWRETDTEVGFLPMFEYPRDQLVKVSATGTAAVLIHRRVLEKVRDKFGAVWFDPITHPTGPTVFSEDLSFCIRVAACDVPMHVHTGVKTTHDKGHVFLDEDYYDAQQAILDGALTGGGESG
jgi:hypothetical protein